MTHTHWRTALASLSLLIAAAGSAQTARPMLDYATAAKVRDGCLAWAGERGLKVAVAVYDESGRLVAFALADGAPTAVAEFAMWKGKSAATIHVASKETANWGNGPANLATWEGGTPIFSRDGAALGGVGVSGASGAEDSACGEAGIAAAGMAPRGS
jgi:glc operon protein GlcG